MADVIDFNPRRANPQGKVEKQTPTPNLALHAYPEGDLSIFRPTSEGVEGKFADPYLYFEGYRDFADFVDFALTSRAGLGLREDHELNDLQQHLNIIEHQRKWLKWEIKKLSSK